MPPGPIAQKIGARLARMAEEISRLAVLDDHALIREVNENREILIKTLGEIEFKGDEKLNSRVEALSRNKTEIDARLAHVFENFQKLDSMRKDIGEIFTSIRGTLNRIG